MKTFQLLFGMLAMSILFVPSACKQKTNQNMNPPIAKKIPVEFNEFGQTRIDNYYWLNDRENQEVIDYLIAENTYTDEVMKKTEKLQEKIYDEIVGRIKQTDMSVPYQLNGYIYYTRFEEGLEYPVYCRKAAIEGSPEEVMLDGNEMAKGHVFFNIGDWDVSPNNEMLAFSVDTVSRRKYTIHFKNLKSGETYDESIPNTSGSMTWANDNKTVFYATKDETLREDKIYKRTIGSADNKSKLVFFEDDSTFETSVYKTKSGKFLVIASGSTLSNEYRILEADNPKGDFRIFQPRQPDLEYEIYHQGNRWLINTNYEAKNFRLMEADEGNTGIEHWKELIPVRNDVLLEGVTVFKDYYVLTERKNGLPRLRVFNIKENTDEFIGFIEDDYMAYALANPDYTSSVFRYGYTSLKTPSSVYDYDMNTGETVLLKQEEVVGGYNPDDYVTERIYAEGRDGTMIPISMVYKKGFMKDGSQPLLLYGYGSYGVSMDSYFVSSRLSLLDRGFAYAVAHIRGGEELGRMWYENGKLLQKKNTFFDFIDCAQFLVKEKYTSSDVMFALGGSAGGLLVGAVINYEPALFKGVIAAVPFVDVVTTMLDESIPLTTGEYDEWGNPNEEEYYNYMLSYSPYDQVKAMDYPNILITAGLHDSQVQYWEPAKWAAKLRDMKTDNNLLLLKTNMDFGHGGASGRFERYKETALEDAFLLMLAGIDH